MHEQPFIEYNPILSLTLFSKGDWSLAVHIAESFSTGQFSRNELHAIVNVLTNNYESALRFCSEGKLAKTTRFQFMATSLEGKAFVVFSRVIGFTIQQLFFRDAIAYLALLESEEPQLSLPVALALSDRVPTGRLNALDVNAITYDNLRLLLIVEARHEDLQMMWNDPDLGAEDIVHHKVGITMPVLASVGGNPISINIGRSRCPICRTIDKAA